MSDRDDQLTDLLAKHRRQLFGFIFCIVQNMDDAEDVFQQTALVMWEKFHQFQEGTNFVAWACSIARFKALHFLQRRSREKAVFSSDLVEEMADRQHDQSALYEARSDALETCRKKLHERDQETLAACYAPGGTVNEAARQLGRSPSSVSHSLIRIRRALARCIERELSEGSES